jgi:hypothetical protein
MNLTRRITALETALSMDETCLVCGAPHTQSIAIIVTPDDAPLRRCTGCGRALNEDGRPLPKCYKRLILPDGDPCKDARAPDPD